MFGDKDGNEPDLGATGARDDAMAMQFLVPDWKYDPKKPSLGR